MKIYKKLFKYVEKERYLGVIAILLSTLSAFITVYSYFFMYKFLEKLIIYEDLSTAGFMAVKIAALMTAGAIAYILSLTFSHLLGFRLETRLRQRGIDGLTRAGFSFFDLNYSGAVRKTIDDNAVNTHMIVAHLIPDNSQAVLAPVLVIGLGFFISIRVGMALIILSIAGGLILSSMMGEKEFMKFYQDALLKLSAETVEYVRGMQVIKIFGVSVASFKSLYNSIMYYSKYAYEYSMSCKRPYVFFQWLFFGLMTIIVLPASFLLNNLGDRRLLTLELIMTLFLSGVLFVSFMRIMYVNMYIFQADYAVNTLEKLFEDMQKSEISFGEDEKFEGFDIEFEDVCFSYDKKLVLNNLSFKLQEGKTYALTGSSGSGKSTIAKLISGFYKIDKGKIKIGGKDICSYTKESLTKNIAFVFQEPKLFKKSIYENVLIADKNAKKEDVLRAMSLAGCASIIRRLPDRENTVIGSKGIYLSGGEKQRIAIARAILKNAEIIIMDEAGASIDPENEYELQRAFKNLMNKKTVVMIAHRLSSIKAVDEILVIEEGRIIERGEHKALVERNSKYKSMQDLYNSANEWRVGYDRAF